MNIKMMARFFCITILWLLLSSRILAERNFLQWESILHSQIHSRDIKQASDLVSIDAMRRHKLDKAQLEKARQIYERALEHHLFSEGDLQITDIENVVRFVELAKNRKKTLWSSNASSIGYVHPSPNILKIPVQIYDKHRIYLHFKKYDRFKKHGGYKIFSRSIDFETGEIFANLVATIKDARNGYRLLQELEVMEDLSSKRHILTYRDASVYQGYKEGQAVHKIVFQAPLYDEDLSRLWEKSLALPVFIEIAKQATTALKSVHEKGYIHRDVKPENFFYKNYKNMYSPASNFHVVVADFGLSHKVSNMRLGKNIAGTRGYIDPDMCLRRARGQDACNGMFECSQGDVYSLGMTFYGYIKGRSNTLRALTTKINNIVLPKDKLNPPPRDSIFPEVENFKREYDRHQPQKFSEASLDSDAGLKYELEYLSWQMLQPSCKARITLDRVLQKLMDLQKRARSDF